MEVKLEKFLVKPGEKVHLAKLDPSSTASFSGDKHDGKKALEDITEKIDILQERLYAQHKRGILVVLQGIDTGGKDGTIEHVFDGVNPQGVRVADFKQPTPEELSHDFLWRIHKQVPEKGEIAIFNRSHYEDVLVVRVHDLVPEKVWRKRYEHINNFERMLTDEGVTILKFFLYIDKEEQRQRLLDRLKEPEKRWKFQESDLKERALWKQYRKAYEDAVEATSTDWAPWYIIPANHKWFRNLVVSSALLQTLKDIDPEPPNPMSKKDLEKYTAALNGEAPDSEADEETSGDAEPKEAEAVEK